MHHHLDTALPAASALALKASSRAVLLAVVVVSVVVGLVDVVMSPARG